MFCSSVDVRNRILILLSWSIARCSYVNQIFLREKEKRRRTTSNITSLIGWRKEKFMFSVQIEKTRWIERIDLLPLRFCRSSLLIKVKLNNQLRIIRICTSTRRLSFIKFSIDFSLIDSITTSFLSNEFIEIWTFLIDQHLFTSIIISEQRNSSKVNFRIIESTVQFVLFNSTKTNFVWLRTFLPRRRPSTVDQRSVRINTNHRFSFHRFSIDHRIRKSKLFLVWTLNETIIFMLINEMPLEID